MKNKRGWIKVVEAVVAIVLLSAVVLIVIGDLNTGESDFSTRIHDLEVSILREIQLDYTLREWTVNTTEEVEGDDAGFPISIKAKITSETPSDLTCEAKICVPGSSCLLASPPDGNVYSEGVIITSTINVYNPRVLKIFCWES